MGLHVQHHVEVAGAAPPLARIALSRNPESGAAVHSPGNLDALLLHHLLHPLSLAGRAGVGDHLPRSLTGGTGSHLGEAAKGGAGGPAHLAGPTAGGTGGGAAPLLGAGSLAGAAGFLVAELHLLLHSEHGLAEGDRELQTEVIPLPGPPTPGATAHPPTAAEATEESFEQIGEPAHVPHVRHAATAQPGFAELVIAGPGLGVAQGLVGTANVLEALFRPGILVDIGVVLPGEASIGSLKGVGIGVASHAEQVIEIGHQPACS